MSTKSLLSALAASLLCATPSAHAQQKPVNLPDGPGKEQVATYCSGCHGLNRVMNSGYPQAYWNTTIRMMLNFGVPIPPDQVHIVTDYLSRNLPEKPKPDANILHGPVKVAIREWQAPVPGSRPHDPLATRDGAIWYTGQMSNRLGRVDPKTGQVREFPLKSPATAPHGLVEDKDGNIWFTGNHISIVGKLDPKTGNVTEYKMPDPKARDPHSLAFAHDGIMVNSRGVPHVVLFGTNKIARVDPQTMEIREYPLPDPRARPRRMAYDGNDVIYYSDFPRGMLGRLDPETGQVTEWPSPGGPRSQPYGIVFAKGAVWYSESGTRPNTIVRFDPATEKFQTWAIPSGGYIVRKMDVTPDGNPVIATSTINGVGLVDVK